MADAASDDSAQQTLVDDLVSAGAIQSSRIERAFQRVPRHAFLQRFWLPPLDSPRSIDRLEHHVVDPDNPDPRLLRRIYSNIAIVTELEEGIPTSSSSEPRLMAEMLEALALTPGQRVLEIGAGTGYNAALLAETIGDSRLVHTTEIDHDLVDRAGQALTRTGYDGIHVLEADGALGDPDHAPFDRVVATVGCPDVAPCWLEQLSPTGFALVPLEHGGMHPLTRVELDQDSIIGRVVGAAGFMRMRGDLGRRLHWPLRWTTSQPTEEERRPLPESLVNREELDHPSWPGFDLSYFLALVDDRTIGPLSLADRRGMLRVDVAQAEVVSLGDTHDLQSDLENHVERWRSLGAPKASDWASRFVSRQRAATRSKQWRVDRIHFTQLVELAGSRP